MEGSNINSMLLAVVLAIAGFIAAQVWDLRKEVTQNAGVIESVREKVVGIERRLQRNQSYLKKGDRYEFSKPPS